MLGAPDVAPALRTLLTRADIDIRCDTDRTASRQVIGIETRGGKDGRSMLVCRPVKAVVKRISSALLLTSISLYLTSAMLSWVAMHGSRSSSAPRRKHSESKTRVNALMALRSIRDTLAFSSQQLIEPVAQLVLMIRFRQPRQIELGTLGQLVNTGWREKPPAPPA